MAHGLWCIGVHVVPLLFSPLRDVSLFHCPLYLIIPVFDVRVLSSRYYVFPCTFRPLLDHPIIVPLFTPSMVTFSSPFQSRYYVVSPVIRPCIILTSHRCRCRNELCTNFSPAENKLSALDSVYIKKK